MTGYHEFKPNTEKCVPCEFWRTGGGVIATRDSGMCHHLLDTGKRRVVAADGECMSYSARKSQGREREVYT